jgi:hypothetical protein
MRSSEEGFTSGIKSSFSSLEDDIIDKRSFVWRLCVWVVAPQVVLMRLENVRVVLVRRPYVVAFVMSCVVQ